MSSDAAVTSMATAKSVLSMAASIATTAMLVRSVASDLIPYEFRGFLFSSVRSFLSRFSSNITLIIDEFDGLNNNQIYDAAQTYLAGRIPPSAQILKVSQPDKDHRITVAMGRNEEIVDYFAGAKFRWILLYRSADYRSFHNPRDLTSTLSSEVRYFELTFNKKHKDTVLNSYLPHIVKEAKSIRNEARTLKIFTVNHDHMYSSLSDAWNPVNLDHPATFATLAMDAEQKEAILADLQRFVRRRDYYRKVGKAWKRGYLLYGPPGTGKSSLIAAMANYLNFNVYDLELTELTRNSDLRRLLVSTANRSILVVEDIDCTIELKDRLEKARAAQPHGYPGTNEKKQITLSGLLNFIDGLWSSCGDERIIIFTTNHKHKLDPALLRPGRMDVHIHMSYCTPCGFRLLASNYLGLKDHQIFAQIEDSIRTTKVTPAEVAEQLLKSDDPEAALRDLIKFLDVKKEEEKVEAEKGDKPESSEDRNEGPSVTVADQDETICYLE